MRSVLDEQHVHPDIRQRLTDNHRDIVDEVKSAIAAHDVLVVGMSQNPFPKRARKALDGKGIKFHYLEYGSYFSMWRERTAIKMFTGWPTFPMIFIKGTLVGGSQDLDKLIESGELDKMLAG